MRLKILQALMEDNEQGVLTELTTLSSLYSDNESLKTYIEKELIYNAFIKDEDDLILKFIEDQPSMYRMGILSILIAKNFVRSFELLLKFSIDVNSLNQLRYDSVLDLSSPLTIASVFDRVDMAKYLIEKGADLLHVTAHGNSILMMTKSLPMYNVIAAEANRKRCFEELLLIQNRNGETVYDLAYFYERFDVLDELIKKIFISKILAQNPSRFLHIARQMTWRFPEKNEYNELCEILRPFKQKGRGQSLQKLMKATLKSNEVKHSTANMYFSLFNKHPEPSEYPTSKIAAIRLAIAQISALLHKPLACIPYLKFINDEFLRYFVTKHGKNFSTLDAKSYQFKCVDGLHFPMPQANYVGIDKASALQEFLISWFSQQGKHASKAYKWVGYIPEWLVVSRLSRGNFVMEHKLTGLFHGKISHMLQHAIIIAAIQDGKISLTFQVDKEMQHITMHDIFDGLVRLSKSDTSGTLMVHVLDSRSLERIQFKDPFGLNSAIMHKGKEFGIVALSDYLIDSFCKGFLKLCQARKALNPHSVGDLTAFFEQMDDLSLELFESSELVTFAIQKEKDKGKTAFFEKNSNNGHAEFQAHYEVDPKFTPGQFKPK